MMNRRKFLISGAYLSALACSGFLIESHFNQSDKKNLAFSRFNCEEGTIYKKTLSELNLSASLYFLNLESGSVSEVKDSVVAHSIEKGPYIKEYAMAVEKRGRCCSLIDLTKSKETYRFFTNETDRLNGHCAFTSDGETAVLSTYEAENRNGLIYLINIKNPKKFEILKTFDSSVHDIVGIGEDELLMAHSGTQNETGFLSVLSLKTKQFQKFLPPSDQNLVFTHLHTIDENRVACLGNIKIEGPNGLGYIYIFDPKKKQFVWQAEDSKKVLSGELLSHVFDPRTQRLWVTLPSENKIVIWDIPTRQSLKVIEITKPYFILNRSAESKIYIGGANKIYAFDAVGFSPIDCQNLNDVTASNMNFGRHCRLMT